MSTMSTATAVSVGFLGAGRPGQKPFFGSCTVLIQPKLFIAKRTRSNPQLVITCDLNHLDSSDVAVRKEGYQIVKQREPYFLEPRAPVELSPDLSTRLHLTETVPPPAAPVVRRAHKKKPHKPRVILLAGPTAVGKTRLSIELAKNIGGEIINADSVQVYQGLDIGAAKATLEERQGVPHHLMDMVPPTDDYPYERFLADSRAAAEDIIARGLVPIIIGGTGIYMRYFMHNRADLTSHPFPGEDLTGEFDSRMEWDYDFQAYFLYQHRADLFPRVDIRCEHMVPALLEETASVLDMGVKPHSNNAANAIGYEEAIDLLLDARQSRGVVSEARFLEFLKLFQHNCKSLVKKQTAWYRKRSRSEVRLFRWIQAGQQAHQDMLEAVVREYERPDWAPSEIQSGMDLMAASFKEQKRMQSYKPALKVFCDAEAVGSTLQWIKSTQG